VFGWRNYNWHANIHAQVFIAIRSYILSICSDRLKIVFMPVCNITVESDLYLYICRHINSGGQKFCLIIFKNKRPL
jgi:hypothetical protein